MKKIILLILILLALVAIIVGAVFLLKPKTPAPVGSPSFPTSPNTPQPGSSSTTNADQVLLQASDGSSFEAKNFLADSATVQDPVNQGDYYLGYHTFEGESTDVPYLIDYNAQAQTFTIAILKEPLGQTRTDMETYLMAHLGLTKQQMCALHYVVTVPNDVSQVYAGKSLGFSFCPGAVALPN